MSKIIILGASSAVSTEDSENTHLVIVGNERMVLVDVPSNATLRRLEKSGLDFNDLTDVVLTHFHPDHTLGLPAVLLDMWLLGRTRPLTIHGLDFTLQRAQALMDLYDWSTWNGIYPVHFSPVPAQELAPLLDCPDFAIFSSPVHHGIPNLGLRVDFKDSRRSFAYSCDTEPCEEVIRLGAGADMLLHEVGGNLPGHTTAQQAGEIAALAEAGKLILIHYPKGRSNLIAEAQKAFEGEVNLAKDFMTLDFS